VTGCSSECCCSNQACEAQFNDQGDTWQQCVMSSAATSEPTILHLTHYYDGCRPSCSYQQYTSESFPTPVSFCDAEGENVLTDDAAVSVCEDGGTAATCKDHYPWVQDRVLYGFAAMAGATANDIPCGVCYQLTFSNARNIDSAVVMVTNAGDSEGSNIDLMVPGGGLGEFTTGLANYGWGQFYEYCSREEGVDTSSCMNKGGFTSESVCDAALEGDNDAVDACHGALFNVFGQLGCDLDDGFPPNLDVVSKVEVACPQVLLDRAYA